MKWKASFFAVTWSVEVIVYVQAYVSTTGAPPFVSRKNLHKLWYQVNQNDPPVDPSGQQPSSSTKTKKEQNQERVLPKLNVTKLLLAEPNELEPLIDLYTIPAYFQALESFPHIDVGSDVLRHDCKKFKCTIFDFDTGHDGKFTVFGSAGASLDSDAIFSNLEGRRTMNPLTYIRDVLSFEQDNVINHAAPGNEKETVVFCGPGLNTLHDQAEEMVKYISRVLDKLPIAHLHAASYLDRGNVEVTVRNKEDFQKYFVGGDIRASATNENNAVGTSSEYYCSDENTNTWTIRAEDRDKIKMVLSGRNLIDTPFKRTLIKLLDVAVASLQDDNSKNYNDSKNKDSHHPPHLVLLCYSATSAEVAAAIKTWLDRATEVSKNRQQSQLLLRKAVTVVTLGATCQQFPDGPAYIHVSMNDDTIATTFGVSSDTPKEWGGNDAVYLHAYSPYFYARTPSSFSTTTNFSAKQIEGMTATTVSAGALSNNIKSMNNNGNDKNDGLMTLNNDAHNLQACLVQWLAIITRVNGARSFRFLYNVIDNNRLDNPPNLEEEVLPAMIRATRGHEWLWNPRVSLGFSKDDDDVDYDDDYIIMDEIDAKMVLEWQYGYDAYEDILALMQDTDFFT